MKVFYVRDDCVVKVYDKQDFSRQGGKFIYFQLPELEEEIILVGNSLAFTHQAISRAATSMAAVKGGVNDIPLPIIELISSLSPTGAGECSGGEIINWHSGGFALKTPDELKPIIAQALCMSYQKN